MRTTREECVKIQKNKYINKQTSKDINIYTYKQFNNQTYINMFIYLFIKTNISIIKYISI